MKLSRLVACATVAALGVLAAPAPSQAAVDSAPVQDVYPQVEGGSGVVVKVIRHYGDRVYIGGNFHRVTDAAGTVYERNGAAAFSASTGKVLAWNPDTNGSVSTLLPTSKGVFVGGEFTKVSGAVHRNLARVALVSGKPFASFNKGTNGPVLTLARTKKSVIAGGDFTKVYGKKRIRLAAFGLKAPYTLAKWAPRAGGGTVNKVVYTRSGVFVGGSFSQVNGDTEFHHLALVRMKDGKVVKRFNPPLIYGVMDFAVTKTRVYVAAAGQGGNVYTFGRKLGKAVWSHRTDGDVNTIKLLGGQVYVGGHFDSVCDDPTSGIIGNCRHGNKIVRPRGAAFSLSGDIQAWNPAGNSQLGLYAFDALPGGRLVAGGAVTTWNDGAVELHRLAVFAPVV